MAYETLLVTREQGIALVTVNRPDKLNALNAVAKRELGEVCSAIASDPDVRVAVITGAGEKAFVAGTDIAELTALDGTSGTAFALGGQAVFDRIADMTKPVIAAVNGYALGGGCELALACHIRIASEKARFGQPEILLGAIPGYGGTQRLPRIVGPGKAMEMILAGTQIDAGEALRVGLVSMVVPPAELIPRAMAMARGIAGMSREIVRRAMEAMHHAARLPLQEGLHKEAGLFGECCATQDFQEGTRAFLEKRKPAFKDT